MIPALAAVGAAAALFFVIVTSGDDDVAAPAATTSTSSTDAPATSEPTETTTTTSVPEAVSLATIAAEPYPGTAPASYRIVYDVVENELARSETITVRRPYESFVRSDRDREMISGTATSRSTLWTYLADRDGWLAVQPELHRAAFDQQPLAAMATAVALGRATEIGADEYLGRSCRRFRTGEPLGNPGITSPSEQESTEVCIDEAGLVLHERWEIDGSVVTERTATEVTEDVEVDNALFDPEPEVEDAEQFEAVLSTLAVPADEETLARLRTDIVLPEGFVLDGAVLRSGTPDRGGDATSEIVRFYTDGSELIELSEFVSGAGVDLDGTNAVPVDVEGPETWFAPDFRASAIRVRLSDNSFVEIRGTRPARLVELLDTLTRRDG